MASSEHEFKKELLRLINEIEHKADDVRHDNSFVYANYDPTEENKVREQGKASLLPMMQSNPLWAFESLFDYLHEKGYMHFFPMQIAEHFVKNSVPIQPELISMLKERLFESKFPFLRQASLHILGSVLFQQSDEKLQKVIMGTLIDENTDMRLISLGIFEKLRDESAIPLISLLLDDTDARVRQKSQLTLAVLNTPAAQLALREWQKQNPKREKWLR